MLHSVGGSTILGGGLRSLMASGLCCIVAEHFGHRVLTDALILLHGTSDHRSRRLYFCYSAAVKVSCINLYFIYWVTSLFANAKA